MNKDTTQGRSRELDQFYTDPSYAKHFYDKIQSVVDFSTMDIILEPSAGCGNFYDLMDTTKRVGIDIDPKMPGILEQDFFDWSPPIDKKVITIGNPPFGKKSNLAIKFFNRAAIFSETIAFILPRTFRKDSVINRLDCNFHLIYDEIVPENSFVFNDNPYDVWCCAQIWTRKPDIRPKIDIASFNQVSEWFIIVEPNEADFSIQRVGGKAGYIRTSNFANYSKQSHYFIKQKDSRCLDVFKKINFEQVKINTVGNPSVSPGELIKMWLIAAKEENLIK
jgi:hypothetical protein